VGVQSLINKDDITRREKNKIGKKGGREAHQGGRNNIEKKGVRLPFRYKAHSAPNAGGISEEISFLLDKRRSQKGFGHQQTADGRIRNGGNKPRAIGLLRSGRYSEKRGD